MTTTQGNIIPLPIKELMERNYLDYSVSVIIDRALPDVRDGLKPVHRRILFAMNELGMKPGTAYKKSARVVGEVIGKFHPHGDTAVYDAAVHLAQPWSKRVALIDGQGNFGSVDGDTPAAMRYTEMRLTKAGVAFFEGIDKNTVDFIDNYDGSEREPAVLPVPYPNIWTNGVEGIAVGMATNILPHNLNETVDSMIYWMDHKNTTVDDILKIMPGPDFPTGGVVHELGGFREALLTGKGRVRLRSKYHVEKTKRGTEHLVIDELPYQVNKAKLHAAIVELVKNKILEDVSDVRDESSKGEIRLVIDLKKGSYPEIVFNQILAKTEAECAYSYNVMVIDNKKPRQMGILDIFDRFLAFRREVVTRRTQFELARAAARHHIVSGLVKALGQIDEVIKTIKAAKNREQASKDLQALLTIDDIQAAAILDMRLQSLTALQVGELTNELAELTARVSDLEDILAKPERIDKIIKAELREAKSKFGSARKTEISYETSNISMADLVKKEPCIVHFTHGGYIKRMAANEVNAQNRYTQGKSGISTGEDDYVQAIYSGSTHDMFMVFTDDGNVRAKRAWQIPEGTSTQKGRHVRNLFDDLTTKIQSAIFVPSLEEEGVYLVTVTEKGKIKRTALAEYAGALRKSGVQALSIEEDDRFISAAVCREHDHIILGVSDGRAIRFEVCEEQLRPMGRVTAGVRGIKLIDDAKVLSLMVIPGDGNPRPMRTVLSTREVDGVETQVPVEVPDTLSMDVGHFLLCVGKNGVGKRTPVSDYAPQNRAGQGVIAFNINKKTGQIVTMALVHEDEDLILTTQSKTNRVKVKDIKQCGRITAGSYIMDTIGEPLMDVTTVPGMIDDPDLLDADDSQDEAVAA